MKSLDDRLADIHEMFLAVFKKLPFRFFASQIGASRQLQRIHAEGFLHACRIVHFPLRMNPFVQKEVGDVTQQQRARILRLAQTGEDIIGGMMPEFPETFGQRTDVYQVIRL